MSEQSQKKNGGASTVSSLINNMVGGVILSLPILFRDAGLGISIIILTISGLVAYKTCILYVVHMSDEEKTIEETIDRISGIKWGKFYKCLAGYIVFFLSIIFMTLIQDRIYGIVYYFMQINSHTEWIAPKDAPNLVFDRFSRQYLSLIMIPIMLLIVGLKSISVIIRLAAVGSVSFILFLLFIIFEFFSNYDEISFDKITWFSTDIGNLTGACAFSFTIHPTVGPIIKNHEKQHNNKLYLMISYITSYIIYVIIGVMGALAVLQFQCSVTVLNCYAGNWRALIVEISYLLGLLTVFPTFVTISRTRLVQYHFGKLTKCYETIFNIFLIVVSTICIFFSPYLPIDLLLNLFGSLICFFLIYLIPSKFHWDCLYGRGSKQRRISQSSSNLLDQGDKKVSLISDGSLSSQPHQHKCAHSADYDKQYSKVGRIALYSFLNLIGLMVAIYGVYQFYQQVIA